MKKKEEKVKKLGEAIDALICANLDNWKGKELFFHSRTPLEVANKNIVTAFQANKIRNRMITEINQILHNGPTFHFRNHHNY